MVSKINPLNGVNLKVISKTIYALRKFNLPRARTRVRTCDVDMKPDAQKQKRSLITVVSFA